MTLKISKEQMRHFDELARVKFNKLLLEDFREEYPDYSDDDFRTLFELAVAGYRDLELKFEDTIRDFIFLCFEDGRALTDYPEFGPLIKGYEDKGYPREEVIFSLAGKLRRQKELE